MHPALGFGRLKIAKGYFELSSSHTETNGYILETQLPGRSMLNRKPNVN